MIGALQRSATKFVIRPFEVKQLFDLAIKLYRSNFAVLFLTQAMVQLPLSLMTLGPMLKLVEFSNMANDMTMTGEPMDFDTMSGSLDAALWMIAAFFGAMAYQLLITPIGNVATAYAAREALHGRIVGFSEAVRFALTRYWATQVALATFFLPLLGISVLILIPVLLLLGPGNEAGLIGASLFGLFLIFAGGAATFLMWFRFFPALTGIVQSAEEPPPGTAVSQGVHYLKRCWQLSAGYFGRLFGLSLLIFFAIGIVNRGVTESINLLVIIGQALMSGQDAGQELMNMAMGPANPMATGITMVLGSLVGMVFPPLMMSYLTLLYYDLRCRKEAYDLKSELGIPQP